eukprot:jgi/Chrzof1/2977/Cz12g06210.t1
MYFSNFSKGHMAEVDADGTVVFPLALDSSNILYGFDTADTGAAVLNILWNPEQWNGKMASLCGSPDPVQQYVDTFSKVTGKKAVHKQLPLQELEKQNRELANMFGWFHEFGYFNGHDISTGPKAVGRPLTTWEQWLRKTG